MTKMARRLVDPDRLPDEIARLPDLDPAELRQRWADLFGSQPPKTLRRDLLIRSMAYRWTSVRTQLAANTRARYIRLDAKDPSLLAGLLYDDEENRLTPTHANKQGKRYRYYGLQPTNAAPRPRGRPKGSGRRWRIAAAEIEAVVIEKLRNVLLDHHSLLDRCVPEVSTIDQQKGIINKAQDLAERLHAASAGELRELLLSLVTRVTLGDTEVRIDLNRAGLLARLGLTDANIVRGDGDGEPKPSGSGRDGGWRPGVGGN